MDNDDEETSDSGCKYNEESGKIVVKRIAFRSLRGLEFARMGTY